MEERSRTLSARTRHPFPRGMVQGILGSRAHTQLQLEHARQLDRARQYCGFSQVVVPGIFSADMGFVPEALQEKQLSPYLDLLFDSYLETNVTPIIHIDCVPEFLQDKQDSATSSWKSSAPRPKLFTKWLQCVELFFQHMKLRSGEDALADWTVLIGRHGQDLSSCEETQQDFFRFYEKTAKKVKDCCSAISVGGPGVAIEEHAFLDQFCTYCSDFEVPLDYLCLDACILDTADPTKKPTLLARRPALRERDTKSYEVIRNHYDKAPPLIITGFSAVHNEAYALHDSYVYPSLMLDALMELRSEVQGVWIKRLSDLEESKGAGLGMYRGASGIFTGHGYRKPLAHVCSFLNAFGSQELVHDYKDCLASIDETGRLHVLLWQSFQPKKKLVAQVYFGNSHPPLEESALQLAISDLAPGHYQLKESRIGYQRGDLYSLYLDQEKPSHSSRRDASLYREASQAVTTESRITIRSDRTLRLELPMHMGEVIYLQANPASL